MYGRVPATIFQNAIFCRRAGEKEGVSPWPRRGRSVRTVKRSVAFAIDWLSMLATRVTSEGVLSGQKLRAVSAWLRSSCVSQLRAKSHNYARLRGVGCGSVALIVALPIEKLRSCAPIPMQAQIIRLLGGFGIFGFFSRFVIFDFLDASLGNATIPGARHV